MEFFKPLVEVAGKFESLTIKITPVGDKLTVLVLPGVNNKELNEKLIPVTMTGIAQELDDEFLLHIKQAVAKVNGVVTNLEQFEKTVEEAGKELAEDAKPAKKDKPEKKKAKPAAKKKAAAPTSGPNSENDKHHQADLEENKVEEDEEEEETEKQEELF